MAQPRQDVGRRAAHVGATNQAEARRLHAEQDVLGHASGAARARAPGKSSPRPRAGRRAGARAGTAAPSSVMRPASGCSAPERMAINVLLPAPFWPTMAQTSPGKTETSTPSTATVAPNVFRMPRISKRGVPVLAALVLLQPAIEVGLQQRLGLGRLHVGPRDDADAGVDPALDWLALELRDDRLDAEVAHVHRILHDEPVDVSVGRAT